MRLVVDANILFAALIKESLTAELIISDNLILFAPEFLFDEFAKYEQYLREKTKRSNIEFAQYLNILNEKIKIIPHKVIMPFIKKAEIISPDPNDLVYLACALATNSKIWSNDKKLKEEQEEIEVITTEELVKKFKIT
ncbi:hypothetical protein LCGC14_1345850 [marine sediment metagenome]|uniref:PIN domain-containing protein n=1 Tax=marine sediment metagenome TaxID=412755 RepID=A0A0F9KYG5_9ZZZZ|nr:MAG: tRNA(fMet)-specific endonuclease VapC [Candidatus Lokiarchaeum sp. GC14_75]